MFFFRKKSTSKKNKPINPGYVITIISVLFLLIIPVAYSIFSKISKAEAWYATGGTWHFRKKIVIDHNFVSGSGNLTNFPVLISITDPDLASEAQNDGDDILFTNAAGTKLDHELDSFDKETGALLAWVEVDTLYGSVNTTLYMYFGDQSVSAQENETGTWNASFRGVWHMSELPSSTLNDSTSAASDGTPQGSMTGDDHISGRVGKAVSFDGVDDAFSLGDVAATEIGTEDFSVSGWIRTVNTSGETHGLLSDGTSGADGYKAQIRTDVGRISFRIDGTADAVENTPGSYTDITNGSWRHITYTFDRNGNATIYIDGISTTTASISIVNGESLTGNTNPTYIGRNNEGGTTYFDGEIDELQLYEGLKTDDWIATEYNNQANPSTFFLVSDLEAQDSLNQPILHLKFDEGVDNSCPGGTNDACDSSDNEHDAAISNGTAWQQESLCVMGKCLKFDGSDDLVTVTNAQTIDMDEGLSDELTFSFFVKVLSDGESNVGEIFYKGAGNYCRTQNEANGAVDLECSLNQATNATVTITDGLTLNTWHHVALAYEDDVDDEITVFIDGKERGSSTNGVGPLDADSANLLIGGNTNFDGLIDEFKIFDTALSASQVRSQHLAGSSSRGSAAVLGQLSTQFLNQDLITYYPMDEKSANTCSGGVNDSCNKAGNATHDAAWSGDTVAVASLTYGYATFLDGSGDYLSVPDNTDFSFPKNQITVSAWVYLQAFTNSEDYTILSKQDSDSAVTMSLRLLDADSGKVRWVVDNEASGLTGVTNISTTTITHVAGTYDGTYLRIFVNGKLDAQQQVQMSIDDTTSALNLGRKSSTANNYFHGGLDEIRIYNRALSTQEIGLLYDAKPEPIFLTKLDENSGTTAKDTGGGLTSATFTGNTDWSNGRFGAGLQFDGTDDVVRFAESTPLDFGVTTESYSVGAWFKTSANYSANAAIVAKQTSTATAYPFVIYLDTSEFGCMAIRDSSANTPVVCGSTALNDGRWHHIMGIRDVNTDTLRLYIDGVLINTTSDTTAAVVSNNDDISIGNSGTTYTQFDFNGTIDQVSIHWYALQSDDVINAMLAQHPLASASNASQVGHYRFDELSLSTANNSNELFPTLTGSLGGVPTWQTHSSCKFFGCIEFEGSDDVVTITNAAPIDFDQGLRAGLTITAWIYPHGAGEGTGGQIFYKGATTWCRTDTLSGGKLDLECSLDLATTDATLNISQILTQNTWHHIAFTYTDDADDEFSIYVDGVLRGSSTNGIGGPATGDTNNLLIGGTISNNFDGLIDEFKIYSAELHQHEILVDQNFNSSLDFSSKNNESNNISGGVGADPVLFWAFDENTGSTIKDLSGNRNDGTLAIATFEPGKYGSGIRFGTDNAQGVTNSSPTGIPANNAAQTLSYWAKVDTNRTGPDVAVQILGSGSSAVQCGVRSSLVGCWKFGGTSLVDAAPPAANTWYHVTYSFDATTHKLYLNGQLVNSSSVAADSGSATNVEVGRNTDSVSEDWDNANVDHLKIWDYTLTDQQVAYEFNRGAPIANWKFDQKIGSISEIGYDATSTGTSTGGDPSFSHTTADQPNRVLIVAVSSEYNVTGDMIVNGITYNSDALTEIISLTAGSGTFTRTGLWYLLNPDVGTYTVDVDVAGPAAGTVAAAMTFYNVAQQAPVTSDSDSITTGTLLTNNITTLVDNTLIVDAAGSHEFSTSFTAGTDQIEVFDTAAGTVLKAAGSYKILPTAGATTMTQTSGSSGRHVGVAAAFEPALENNVTPDSSGNNYHGTLNNMEIPADLVAGRFNKALDFDGVDEYVTVTDQSVFDLTGSFSITAWITTSAANNNNFSPIITKSNADTDSWNFRVNSDDELQLVTGTGVANYHDSIPIPLDQWVHVAVVFDDVANTVSFYVNGQYASGTSHTGTITTNSNNVSIAARPDGTNRFDGQIDEVQVYTYPLSPAQIRNVANNTAFRFGP